MGKPKRPAKPNVKGRNTGSRRFVMLDHACLESAAYSSLTALARSLLTELLMLYNGYNNGSLYLSVRDAAARIGMADLGAVGRAFDELCNAGFIECAKGSSFTSKAGEQSRARCWRLTMHAWPEAPQKKRQAPTNDWRGFAPPSGKSARRADKRLRALSTYKKREAAGSFPVRDSLTTAFESPEMAPARVQDSRTLKGQKVAKLPILRVRDSSTHIHTTRGRCWAKGIDWSNTAPETIEGLIAPKSLAA